MVIPQLRSNNKIHFILLLILGAVLIVPLLDTRYIPGHDSAFHIMRIESIAESLRAGIFPVRMYVNPIQFWGAPVGIFYPSLFLYIPALLKLIGIPIEVCYNIFIIMIIYMGLFASWWGFSFLTNSKHIGLLSTALYISSGYYLLDAYIRNALGELSALSFMPLTIGCLLNLANKIKVPVKIYILTILSVTAIIESHILSTIFLVFFIFIYLLLQCRKNSALILKRFSFIALIIFMLNASFLIPFFVSYATIPLSTVHYIENFYYSGLKKVILLRFIINWNFGLFISCYYFLFITTRSFLKYHKCKQHHHYLLCLFTGLFLLFASSELFPWDAFTLISNIFKYMQFSWRFLGYSTLLLSACGGFGIYLLLCKIKNSPRKNFYLLLSLLICSMNMIAFWYLNPAPTENIFKHATRKYYWNDMLPKLYHNPDFYDYVGYLYNDTDIASLINQKNHYHSNAIINNYQKKSTNISFDYYAKNDSEIILPLMNYPGYIVTNQAEENIKIQENKNHMMVIPLPKGNGKIRIHYEGLFAFKIADFVSLASLLIIIYYVFLIHKHNNWNKLI